MNYEAILLAELDRGFSKADLERLIGLPKNNLSGILKGDRNLSKKSQLKIDKWMASEKPDPLQVFFVKEKVKENNLPENKARILAERNTVNNIGKKFKDTQPLPESEMIPPMPKREDFESGFTGTIDFGAAKSEWKIKYNQ